MTRSGDEYVRGPRDGRTVLLNGERVADVTTHPAFAAGIRTIAQLYGRKKSTNSCLFLLLGRKIPPI